MSRAELLRPWADAPCPSGVQPKPLGVGTWHAHLDTCACHGDGLDPRFVALRGDEHEFVWMEDGRVCVHCGEVRVKQMEPEDMTELCLRTDLGALVRVAAACGLYLDHLDNAEVLEKGWHARFTPIDAERHQSFNAGIGDTPEAAATAALVAALPERAA